jgi:ketol-acid reductoisomerase
MHGDETGGFNAIRFPAPLFDRAVQTQMRSALHKIRSGEFAREFIREMKTGRTHYAQFLRKAENHPMEKVGGRLRGMMVWRAKT